MTTSLIEEVQGRQQRAEEWIVEAGKHIDSAERLLHRKGQETLTLYHLQQSMEMAANGLARASGVSHNELKSRAGHNILFLFGTIIGQVIDTTGGAQFADGILANFHLEGKNYSVSKHIQEFLAATASPREARASGQDQYARAIFSSALKMTPHEVSFLLSSFDEFAGKLQWPRQLRDQITNLTADPIRVERPNADTDWKREIINQALEQMTRRTGRQLMSEIVELLHYLNQSQGEMRR